MAAPTGTIWGSTVGSYGRIGLKINVTTNNATTYAGTVDVWFWSKYSVDDTANTLYFDNRASSGSATTSKGSLSVKTTVASGDGWSTSNQIKLGSYAFSYTKGTATAKRYIYAKLANIDRVGGTMYASTTFDVPKKASYTVSYNANGGSGAPSSQTKWHGTALTLSSTKPTRSGYTFQGWATSSTGSVAYSSGASYTGNAAVTLYAVWKANTYQVKFNANGGTGAPSTQTKTHGTALTLSSTKPTRANYTFKGWATSANATTATYQAGGSYTANAGVTLYAVWELSYIKPKISNLSAKRCNGAGTLMDDGGFAKVSFRFETFLELTSIFVQWQPENNTDPSAVRGLSPTPSGNSVSCIIGDGYLDPNTSYTITVTVGDGTDSTTRNTSITGQQFPIDVLNPAVGKGVAVGKPAELDNTLDIAYDTKSRGHFYVGDKGGHLDGKQGAMISNEGYMHLQRTTAQGYHPYIGFLLDDATEIGGQIRLNCTTRFMEFLSAAGYKLNNATYITGNTHIGAKTGYQDGNTGVYINKAGYIHIQRASSDGNPYLAFYKDAETTGSLELVFNASSNMFAITNKAGGNIQQVTNGSIGFSSNGTFLWFEDANTVALRPATAATDKLNLGISSARWLAVYAKSGSVSTSDREKKKNIQPLSEKLYDLASKIDIISYQFKETEQPDNVGRTHIGSISQQVEEAMQELGLTSKDFAGFCKDQRQAVTVDENGAETFTPIENEYDYSLRYEELAMLKIAYLERENRALKDEITALKQDIAAIKEQL